MNAPALVRYCAGHAATSAELIPAWVRHNTRNGVYIRSKRVKGNLYYYLVEGRREGKTVRQKVIKYLGKRPITAHTRSTLFPDVNTTAWETLSPARFRPVIRKDYQTVFTTLLMRLGASSVTFDLPPDSPDYGHIRLPTKAVHFRPPVSGLTMAHELGHLIDFLLARQHGGYGRHTIFAEENADLDELYAEFQRIADYRQSTRSGPPAALTRLRRLRLEYPDHAAIRSETESLENYYFHYAYSYREAFANLCAISLIEPRKAKQLAPRASQWLIQRLYQHPDIRAAFTEAGIWELAPKDHPGPPVN